MTTLLPAKTLSSSASLRRTAFDAFSEGFLATALFAVAGASCSARVPVERQTSEAAIRIERAYFIFVISQVQSLENLSHEAAAGQSATPAQMSSYAKGAGPAQV